MTSEKLYGRGLVLRHRVITRRETEAGVAGRSDSLIKQMCANSIPFGLVGRKVYVIWRRNDGNHNAYSTPLPLSPVCI